MKDEIWKRKMEIKGILRGDFREMRGGWKWVNLLNWKIMERIKKKVSKKIVIIEKRKKN